MSIESQHIELPLVVSPMGIADLEDVVRIEDASFAIPWTRTMFVDEILNGCSRSIVFRQGTTLVGYRCHWVVTDEAHLMTIAVHPGHRRKGLGEFIMAHLEADCLAAGLSRIILEVAKTNEDARRLYRKCGFETVGFRKNYYGTVDGDALIMEKVLPNADEPASRSDSGGN